MKLRASQVETLRAVAVNSEITAQEVGRVLGITAGLARRRLRDLQNRGHVERWWRDEPRPQGGGAPYRFRLTQLGKEALASSGKEMADG